MYIQTYRVTMNIHITRDVVINIVNIHKATDVHFEYSYYPSRLYYWE